jgi:hypothetical protein
MRPSTSAADEAPLISPSRLAIAPFGRRSSGAASVRLSSWALAFLVGPSDCWKSRLENRSPAAALIDDLFEARPADQTGMSLKEAFAAFRTPEIKVQLVPGDPQGALRRVANSLTGTDLLLIAANQDRQSLAEAWTWVPRMLTARSLIFAEPVAKPGTGVWRKIELEEVQKLAAAAGRALRRAA